MIMITVVGMVVYFTVSAILIKRFQGYAHILAVVLPLLSLLLFPLWFALFLAANTVTVVFGYNPDVSYYNQSEFNRKHGYLTNKIGIGLFVAAAAVFIYDVVKFFHLL